MNNERLEKIEKSDRIELSLSNVSVGLLSRIKVNLDNSRNIFNIRGILDSDSLNTSSFTDYIPNIKYIRYINGIDISINKNYVMDIFKQYGKNDYSYQGKKLWVNDIGFGFYNKNFHYNYIDDEIK